MPPPPPLYPTSWGQSKVLCSVRMVLLQGWLNVNWAKQKNDFATIWWLEFIKIAPCNKTCICRGLGFWYVRGHEKMFLFAKWLRNFKLLNHTWCPINTCEVQWVGWWVGYNILQLHPLVPLVLKIDLIRLEEIIS